MKTLEQKKLLRAILVNGKVVSMHGGIFFGHQAYMVSVDGQTLDKWVDRRTGIVSAFPFTHDRNALEVYTDVIESILEPAVVRGE